MVRAEFGGDLHRMNPANVREFLDRVEPQVDGNGKVNGRVRLDEPEISYEGIVRDFLRQSLEIPPDQAVIRLWLFSLELATAGVAEVEAERFRKLFALLADGQE